MLVCFIMVTWHQIWQQKQLKPQNQIMLSWWLYCLYRRDYDSEARFTIFHLPFYSSDMDTYISSVTHIIDAPVLYVHVHSAELLKAPLDITVDLFLQQPNNNFPHVIKHVENLFFLKTDPCWSLEHNNGTETTIILENYFYLCRHFPNRYKPVKVVHFDVSSNI